jgi:TrmH family RNA methyltransferase
MHTGDYHAIESRRNERYKWVTRLVQSGKERRREGKIILDGIHLTHAYIEHFGASDVEIFVTPDAALNPEVKLVLDALQPQQVSILSEKLMNELAPSDSPVGLVAAVALPSVPARSAGGGRFCVALEGVQDPGNVGSVMRTAVATGVSQMWLARGCADPWSPKSLRGGMGAQFMLQVNLQPSIKEIVSAFNGLVIATVPRGGRSLYKLDLRGDVLMLFGGEGSGLSEEALACATVAVSLPMSFGVESINLAAAVAACCFERSRQSQPSAAD